EPVVPSSPIGAFVNTVVAALPYASIRLAMWGCSCRLPVTHASSDSRPDPSSFGRTRQFTSACLLENSGAHLIGPATSRPWWSGAASARADSQETTAGGTGLPGFDVQLESGSLHRPMVGFGGDIAEQGDLGIRQSGGLPSLLEGARHHLRVDT